MESAEIMLNITKKYRDKWSRTPKINTFLEASRASTHICRFIDSCKPKPDKSHLLMMAIVLRDLHEINPKKFIKGDDSKQDLKTFTAWLNSLPKPSQDILNIISSI